MKKQFIAFAFSIFTYTSFSQSAATNTTTSPIIVVVTNEARLIEVNKTIKTFVTELHALNFAEVRKILAPNVNENTTDANLETLSKNIKKNDELVVFNQNMEHQSNGTGPVLIEYKYKSETEAPEIFTVTFDLKNRITGFNSSKVSSNAK